MSEGPVQKYRARVDELESLKAELATPVRAADLAPVVRRVLEAAGDLLRRTEAAPAPAQLIDAALALVAEAQLAAWAAEVGVAEVGARLARAASQAVEAALPEVEGDGQALADWAMEDLKARDRLESALVAAEHLGRTRGDARALAARVRAQADAADRGPRRQVAALTALNPSRRAEGQLLDGAHRQRAWWFEERCGAGDDLLVKALGGEGKLSAGSAEARADAAVKQRRPRRYSFDELLAADLGLGGDGALAALKAQATRDPELNRVLAAMAEGERAIAELTGEAQAAAGPADAAPRPVVAGEAGPQVVLERAEFKVLVLRPRGRVQVVVQPHRIDRLHAAAVSLPDEGGRELKGEPQAKGLTFELGKAAALKGRAARVTVELVDGRAFSAVVSL